jgi:hypothetical protein
MKELTQRRKDAKFQSLRQELVIIFSEGFLKNGIRRIVNNL